MSTITSEDFQALSQRNIIRRTNPRLTPVDHFRRMFGVEPLICSIAWPSVLQSIRSTNNTYNNLSPSHLLWALLFLNTYSTEAVLANTVGVTEKMFRKWVRLVVKHLALTNETVVSL